MDFNILIRYIVQCQYLRTLQLNDNPISDHDQYKVVLVGLLPTLNELDNEEITESEKENYLKQALQSVPELQQTVGKEKFSKGWRVMHRVFTHDCNSEDLKVGALCIEYFTKNPPVNFF